MMAAKNYSEFPEDKDLANKPSNAKGGKGAGVVVPGSEHVTIKYKTGTWGLKGAPQQPRDRSNGMRRVSACGKSEGLGANANDDAYINNLFGRSYHGR